MSLSLPSPWTLALPLLLTSAFYVNASTFPPVRDMSQSGPFTVVDNDEGPECRVYRPRALGEDGRRHPVILWGNGTGASHMVYGRLLSHWASHGFVVAAAKTFTAGSGEAMLSCLDYLVEQDAQSNGQYENKLELNKVGVSGHSQGAGGAIMAAQDERITVTAPMQPYVLGLGHDTDSHANQAGPMFLMTGGKDRLVPSEKNASVIFDNINVPLFWGELDDAGHFEPIGDGGDYKGPSTAWFRLHLMADQDMASLFEGDNCGLCNSSSWTVRTRRPAN